MDDPTNETLLDMLLLRQAVEALIFAADEPVTPSDVRAVLEDVTGLDAEVAAIERAVDALNDAYAAADHAFRIERWAGGYRLATRPELAAFVQAYLNPQRTKRLSRTLLETLAILAYRQPATKPEVDAVRGVDSDYAVRKLMELGLIDVVGRSESLGRPLLYGTTPKFLETFGLASLDSLPTLREIEDLLGDPQFSDERAELLLLRAEADASDASTDPTTHADAEPPTS